MMAMRRPGYDTSLLTSAVNGSEMATAKNGSPAMATASGRCLMNPRDYGLSVESSAGTSRRWRPG